MKNKVIKIANIEYAAGKKALLENGTCCGYYNRLNKNFFIFRQLVGEQLVFALQVASGAINLIGDNGQQLSRKQEIAIFGQELSYLQKQVVLQDIVNYLIKA